MTAAPRFAIFIYDGVEPIDLGATFGTLSMARRIAPEIEIYLVAQDAGPVPLTNGMVVQANYGFSDCPPADYLIVSGGPGWPEQCKIPEVADFIRKRAATETVASVCTGAMILAKTGLLDNLQATTKKEISGNETAPINLLATAHPAVKVVDALIVDNGAILTGGGVVLAIDATLHLLSRSLGPEVADETARILEYSESWKQNKAQRPTYYPSHAVTQ
ncbi:MAG: DJ-1/PfpI family protein [Alphaproteobacteria bacterium]|uniref:DJ-1/PfpI family protein n=1 Tax=Roseibium sp. TaxID=1936156 RepID=UPI003271F784